MLIVQCVVATKRELAWKSSIDPAVFEATTFIRKEVWTAAVCMGLVPAFVCSNLWWQLCNWLEQSLAMKSTAIRGLCG